MIDRRDEDAGGLVARNRTTARLLVGWIVLLMIVAVVVIWIRN